MSTQPTGRDHDHAREVAEAEAGLIQRTVSLPYDERYKLAAVFREHVAAAVAAERERTQDAYRHGWLDGHEAADGIHEYDPEQNPFRIARSAS